MKRRKPAQTVTAAPPVHVAAAGTPYLDHPARMMLIFGSFFLLCVPLAVRFFAPIGSLTPANWILISQIYAILLGNTHFAITFSIYLNSQNLEYFKSSRRNILIYFWGPALILSLWFLIGFLGINQARPDSSTAFLAYLFYFALLTKLADYLHVVRQSFGVLQLFKRHVGVPFPFWMRRTENAFFIAMLVLQLLTFQEGLRANTMDAARFNPASPFTQIALVVAGGLFLAVIAGFGMMASRPGVTPKRLLVPLYYFLLQTGSAALPVYWSTLYLASLAMHYVEYHVIMYPRVFQPLPDSRHTVDQIHMWLREHKAVFYLALALIGFWMTGLDAIRNSPPAWAVPIFNTGLTWFFLNLLNGVFMAHYFIEAFVWKFGEPFYRKSLTPLYFPSR